MVLNINFRGAECLLRYHHELYYSLVEDVDLQLMTFSDFGKDVPKMFKLSPDGFIQMAIQLAYYKYAYNILSYQISIYWGRQGGSFSP